RHQNDQSPAGCGCVQSEGQEKVEVRPGDVIWCSPKERHWHGATTTTALQERFLILCKEITGVSFN
ncbi:MAG TPA: hypothetical protein VHP99_14825, partial [Pyrinomonadaceae bacterium]|nr:hypothetical protein [Pyrinomonadaceae bacterium]